MSPDRNKKQCIIHNRVTYCYGLRNIHYTLKQEVGALMDDMMISNPLS
jgi:hypothetical protein